MSGIESLLMFFGLLPLTELFQSMKQSKTLTIMVIAAVVLFTVLLSVLFLF